jgi:hypothetical protein
MSTAAESAVFLMREGIIWRRIESAMVRKGLRESEAPPRSAHGQPGA